MKVGAHVSIAGGIDNAPLNASSEGCEVFQIFSRSPRGGKAPTLTQDILTSFQKRMERGNFPRFYIHAPYFVNFASKNNRIRFGSIRIVREELERGTVLGASFVVTHLGSAKDYPDRKEALEMAAASLSAIFKAYKGSCGLALENSAGAGGGIGAKFLEIHLLLDGIRKRVKIVHERLGVCLDTAHMFAAGYDIRNTTAVTNSIACFDRKIGLSELRLFHLNDSEVDFSELVDRHEHIGQGKIGSEGLAALFHHPRLRNFDFILETAPDKRKEDVALVKKLRR